MVGLGGGLKEGKRKIIWTGKGKKMTFLLDLEELAV